MEDKLSRELWNKISSFEIDDLDSKFNFSARLSRDNSWTSAYTKRVIGEYKRFIFLCCVSDFSVTPSDEVDKAWHLHLIYTDSYWNQMCEKLSKRPIHHCPTKGGAKEREKFKVAYQKTLENYKLYFGENPPKDIWPPVEKRFAASWIKGRLNFTKYFPISAWKLRPLHTVVLLLCSSVFLVSCSDTFNSFKKDFYKIVDFVRDYPFASIVILLVFVALFFATKNDDSGCSCGGCGD